MRSSSDLKSNGFHILKADYSSSAAEISDLLEDAEFDGTIPQEALLNAQQSLVTPLNRLVEELSWLPELSQQQTTKALQAINAQEWYRLPEQTDHFPELARANILAHCVSQTEGSEALIQPLCQCWDNIGARTLAEFINENRKLAGFPLASVSQIEDALSSICLQQAATAANAIWRSGVPGFLMNTIVENELARKADSTFLKNLVREYDKNCESDLAVISQKIECAVEKANHADDDLAAHIQDIDGLLFQWDEINQPVQLYEQSRGHEEPRSKALYRGLRDLSIDLANNHNRYEASLQLSEALLRTFPELESVAETLRGDVFDLEDLIEKEKSNRHLQPLFEACEAAKDASGTLIKSALRADGFSERAQGIVGRIAAAFFQANANLEDPSVSYLIVRDLGLYWNNDKNDPEAAFLLIDGLITHARGLLQDSIREKLTEDRVTLYENWKLGELQASKGNPTATMRILDDLSAHATAEKKREYTQLKRKIQTDRTVKFIRWGVFAAIAFFIFVATMEDDSRNRSNSSAQTQSSPSVTSSNTETRGASVPTRKTTSAFPELKPPVGSGTTLSESQLRYCIYQQERLEYLRIQNMTNSEINRFNQLIADWNSRCSSYRYQPTTKARIEREAANKSTELQQEARRIFGR